MALPQLALTPVAGLWVAFAVAAGGLAVLVLRARPVTRGNLVLVALLAQQAWQALASVVRSTAVDEGVAWQATLVAIPAWLLWAPIVWLAGPLLLGNVKHAWVVRGIGLAGALPGLVLAAAWPFAPQWTLDEAALRLTPAGAGSLFLAFGGFAFTVAVLAREALTTPLPVRRGMLALLAAAFSVEGAYHAAQNTAKIALGSEFFGAEGADALQGALSVLPLVAFLGIAGWALWRAQGDRDRARWGRVLAGCIGASALSGALASQLTVGNEFTDPAGAFHALWDLAALALIVYAGLRFQLFSLERRARQGVAVSAAVGLGFVSFNVLQELAEGALADVEVFAGLPASGIVAALAVGVVSVPIGKAGNGFARKLFPHLGAFDYEAQRRKQIYLAALEGALADGIATPRETTLLKRLRAELRIGEDEHDVLEGEVRRKLAAGTPA